MKRILLLILSLNFTVISGCALFTPSEEIDVENLPPTASGPTTVTSKISTSNDDAEQKPSGNISLGSSDLELTTDRGNVQTIGLRFKLDVPQGKRIESAKIQFTADEVTTNTTSLKIYAEATDNASEFKATKNNISDRRKTSSSVTWKVPGWTKRDEAGANQLTPSLSTIVQEVIDRKNWKSGNHIAFIITGTGTRTAESYNGKASSAPKLIVKYTEKLVEPEPTLPPNLPPVVFGYSGADYDPLVKPVYDLGYRDGVLSVDTDKDGLPDSWEIAYNLDPSDPNDGLSDLDQDLLTAKEEFLAATSPKDSDSDGDGMPDGHEVAYSLNPLDSSDALDDMDGDGYNNLDEYLKGTDPSDPLAYPIVVPNTYTVSVNWEAPTSRTDETTLSPNDIASFTIYYGTSESTLDMSVIVSDPKLRTYQLNLNSTGDYFFKVTATDTDGNESRPSTIARINITP